MPKFVSVVVPAHNEEGNIRPLFGRVAAAMEGLPGLAWEAIFVNDGSTDGSDRILREMAAADPRVRFIELSRNFGKEAATSAGLHCAKGDAVLMIDADLQHPPELIPEFVAKWEAGADLVIGLRRSDRGKGSVRRLCDRLYYRVMRAASEFPPIPNATDFRLLDRRVVRAFAGFSERDRMTRGLIGWLGFRRDFVPFDADPRLSGTAAYSRAKLVRLAMSSLVAHSLLPLKLIGYLGAVVTLFFGAFGLALFLGKYVFAVPLFMSFSGTAQLAVLLIFLVGIILSGLGLIALYISAIQREALNRPLYVVRDSNMEEKDS